MDGLAGSPGSAPDQGCGPLLQGNRDLGTPLRQQVFEHVRAKGRAARTDIARALGISAGSATTLTADLIATGILREVSGIAREHGRGRPPVALEVVPDAVHVIGIKLSYERHTAVLADFAGRVSASVALSASGRPQAVGELMEEIAVLVELLMRKSARTLAEISAVAIGLPGIVDHESGRILWSALLQSRNEDLAGPFAERFGMPPHLDNDANMLTLAELWFGAGRAVSDFVVVTIENGVGMGMVLNNRLYRGAHGMGLELGHTKVQLDGALCRCGQRGCLEAYLADYALAREAATALNQTATAAHSARDLLETLFAEAKAGNPAAQTIFRRAGRYMSLGLSNVVQLLDPELIILSGDRMQYDYLYEEDVIAEMQQLVLVEDREPCRVAVHAWGDLVWARGATACALSELTARMIGGEARA